MAGAIQDFPRNEAVQNEGYCKRCSQAFCELIGKIISCVIDFFKNVVNCFCPGTFARDEEVRRERPIAVEPILPFPPRIQIPGIPGISGMPGPALLPTVPLHLDIFPTNSDGCEAALCPEVPPFAVKGIWQGRSLKEAIQKVWENAGYHTEMREGENTLIEDVLVDGLGQKFTYLGPTNVDEETFVQGVKHRFFQEDFIRVLQDLGSSYELAPLTIELPPNRDISGEIERALSEDPPTAQKLRLARLALVWVQSNRAFKDSVPDPTHPFHEIFEELRKIYREEIPVLRGNYRHDPKDSHFNFCAYQLIGFQELTRILPLLKAFAAEKRRIRVTDPLGLCKDVILDVNPLLDFVIWISQAYTRIYTYRTASPIQIPLAYPVKNGPKSIAVKTKELTGDKVIRGANLFWAAYQRAKANGDTASFFHAMKPETICFDKRIFLDLSQYLEGGGRDFVLNSHLMKKDILEAILEYRRVFVNEQCALFCEREEGFHYSELQAKFNADSLDKENPKIQRFYQDYFTENRFRQWVGDRLESAEKDWLKLEASSDEGWLKISGQLNENGFNWE